MQLPAVEQTFAGELFLNYISSIPVDAGSGSAQFWSSMTALLAKPAYGPLALKSTLPVRGLC